METQLSINRMANRQMNIIGLGFSEKANVDSFESLLHKTGINQFDQIAVLAQKAEHLEMQKFAKIHKATIISYEEHELEGIMTPTKSKRIQTRFNLGSICEALVIFACKPNAELTIKKVVSDDGYATFAMAKKCEGNLR